MRIVKPVTRVQPITSIQQALIGTASKNSLICYKHCSCIFKIMQIIVPLFVNYTYFSKTSRNHGSTLQFKFGNLQQQPARGRHLG